VQFVQTTYLSASGAHPALRASATDGKTQLYLHHSHTQSDCSDGKAAMQHDETNNFSTDAISYNSALFVGMQWMLVVFSFHYLLGIKDNK